MNIENNDLIELDLMLNKKKKKINLKFQRLPLSEFRKIFTKANFEIAFEFTETFQINNHEIQEKNPINENFRK